MPVAMIPHFAGLFPDSRYKRIAFVIDARGGLDSADRASWGSCAFIQTQDVGRVAADGAFEVEGRIDHSDIRGCNLLVQ